MSTESKPPLLADYLSRDEAAAQLGVSKVTLHNYERLLNGLPSLRIGARRFYRRADLQAFLDRRMQQLNPTRGGK